MFSECFLMNKQRLAFLELLSEPKMDLLKFLRWFWESQMKKKNCRELFVWLEKVYRLEYFRGTWDHLIPELKTEEEKLKVEGYQCNVCGKKFRNNPTRGEFPARGSFICHWATEHGKVRWKTKRLLFTTRRSTSGSNFYSLFKEGLSKFALSPRDWDWEF